MTLIVHDIRYAPALKNMKDSIDNVEITGQQTFPPACPFSTHFHKALLLTCALLLLVAISKIGAIILHFPKYKDLLHKGEKNYQKKELSLKICL